jgi:uncharacterized OB-fold protein
MADNAAPEVPPRMLPKLDDRNRMYWTGGADGQLRIAWCAQCELWVQPPAAVCPDCGGELVARAVSGRGSVFTSDSVYVGLPVEVRFERHEVDGGTVYFPVFAPRS